MKTPTFPYIKHVRKSSTSLLICCVALLAVLIITTTPELAHATTMNMGGKNSVNPQNLGAIQGVNNMYALITGWGAKVGSGILLVMGGLAYATGTGGPGVQHAAKLAVGLGFALFATDVVTNFFGTSAGVLM